MSDLFGSAPWVVLGPSHPVERERRLHPRSALQVPLRHRQVGGDRETPCESVDVSAGGMRIRSSARIPLGPCEVVLSATPDSLLVFQGEVVEEIVDASTGEVTARIVFAPVAPAAYRELLSLPGTDRRPTRSQVLIAGAATALVVAAGWLTVTNDEGIVDDVRATGPTATEGARPSPLHAPPVPPATAVHRTEGADNLVRVVLRSSPEETSVASTVGPSEGVDEVRVQLDIIPEQNGTAMPVRVTLENRGDETITFAPSFTAIVSAARAGTKVASVTLTSSDVTEVAPGETVAVEGVLDFGSPGQYDVIAEVGVAV